jgi:hypothetical protein
MAVWPWAGCLVFLPQFCYLQNQDICPIEFSCQLNEVTQRKYLYRCRLKLESLFLVFRASFLPGKLMCSQPPQPYFLPCWDRPASLLFIFWPWSYLPHLCSPIYLSFFWFVLVFILIICTPVSTWILPVIQSSLPVSAFCVVFVMGPVPPILGILMFVAFSLVWQQVSQ